MEINWVEVAHDVLDAIERYGDVHDYYTINHLSSEQIAKIGTKLSGPISDALKEVGIEIS